MRAQDLHLNTSKETPADAEIASHRLMLRAGLIRRLASGLYTWMPLGLRSLRKVETIVREEMDRAGALELVMPLIQPAELWQETGRWDDFGPLLLKIKDANKRDYCFGPTHEEVITDIARKELLSYKQLPVNYYQIHTKFRDEIRPRFGVMRAREFLMKDAYSFHLNPASLADTYQKMHATYSRIFSRIGLRFRAVEADSGAIGGGKNHEFHVLADSGEDALACSDTSDYAANVETAEAVVTGTRPAGQQRLAEVATPGQTSIDAVSQFLNRPPDHCVKTLIVEASDGPLALVLRGDHSLNPVKAEKLPELGGRLKFSAETQIRELIGAGPGSIGPVDLPLPMVVDRAAAMLADFVCGANKDGYHLTGVNWGRDLPEPRVADLRQVVDGDPSPDGRGRLRIIRGIEVGHIFQLDDTYTRRMQASVLDQQGRSVIMHMGCYGIGISRIVAAAIEQNHDPRGIIWPSAIAPFAVALVPVHAAKSPRVAAASEQIYQTLCAAGFEVLLDDRGLRPGVSFADMELIGIPHRLVVSDKTLDGHQIEYRGRRDSESQLLDIDHLVEFLRAQPPA